MVHFSTVEYSVGVDAVVSRQARAGAGLWAGGWEVCAPVAVGVPSSGR